MKKTYRARGETVLHVPESGRTAPRHPTIAIALHWATLAALILGVSIIFLREDMDGRALRYWMLELHRHMGLLVLWLLFARLFVRSVRHRLSAISHAPHQPHLAAGVTHAVIYLLLAAVPLLGWVLSNASGHMVNFFGISLPTLVDVDEDLGDSLSDWHHYSAWLLMTTVCIHAIAALWHHFIRRDHVLLAMLPQRKSRQ